MEKEQIDTQKFHKFAVYQLQNQQKSAEEVQQMLIDRKLDPELAASIVAHALKEPRTSVIESSTTASTYRIKEDNGVTDMIFGALWCIGGIVATLASIGYIFYGAIIFGAFQFIRGVVKSVS